MKNLRTKIAVAINEAEVTNILMKEVSLQQYEGVLAKINSKFLITKKYSGSTWWWTVYKETNSYGIHFPEGNAFEVLNELLPSDKKYWFVASEENGKYWLYESNIESIQWLIGNMHAFEYYIIDKKYEWILCENHHNILIGVGQKIKEKLKAYEFKSRYYAEIEKAYKLKDHGLVLSLHNKTEKKTISTGEGIKIVCPDGSQIVSKVKGIVFKSGDILIGTDFSKEDFPTGSIVLLTSA